MLNLLKLLPVLLACTDPELAAFIEVRRGQQATRHTTGRFPCRLRASWNYTGLPQQLTSRSRVALWRATHAEEWVSAVPRHCGTHHMAHARVP